MRWSVFFICLSAASAVRDVASGSLQVADDKNIQQYDMMEKNFPTIAMDARAGSAEMIGPVQFTAIPPVFRRPVIIRNKVAMSVDPSIKIVGPENSGTNFLYELLKKNNISTLGHSYASDANEGCGGWKHWPLQYAPSVMTSPDYFHIKLARHPLSWLLSMQKKNYDADCKEWHQFKNCTFKLPVQKVKSKHKKTLPEALKKSNLDHEGRLHFDNLIQLWNLYYSGYLKSNTAGVIVRYEDLLVHPKMVLKQIGKQVNVDVGTYRPVLGCAKGKSTACQNDGFEAAKHYNIDKLYMSYYRTSKDLLDRIDKLIDHSVLKALGYQL